MKVLHMKVLLGLGLGAVSSLVAFGAVAQVQRSGNDNARVVQQLQQLTAEKAEAQAENTKLKAEVEDLKAKLAKASAAQAASDERAKKVAATSSAWDSAAVQQANDALARSREQMQELVGKFRETAQGLKDVEIDRDQLRGQVSTKDRDLKSCVDKNAGLYLVSDEILQRMENRGVWSALTDKEPFTKLSRTRLDNLIDEYRYRVDELRVTDKKTANASN